MENQKTNLMDKINEKGAKIMLSATNQTNAIKKKKFYKPLTSILVVALTVSMLTLTVSATGGGGEATATADSMIDSIIDLLKTWIPRLGGLIVVVGGIILGVGFQSDSPDQKTRGMQTMIGGAIVSAIGGFINF